MRFIPLARNLFEVLPQPLGRGCLGQDIGGICRGHKADSLSGAISHQTSGLCQRSFAPHAGAAVIGSAEPGRLGFLFGAEPTVRFG